MVMCSGFARQGENTLTQEIAYGDGLLGQCALEMRPIELNEPTPGYLQVASGLGAAAPKTLLIQPVINNNTLLGIIELALTDKFSPDDQALIDNALPMLALCMEIMARNQHTQDLLDNAQLQADELAYQQQQNANSEQRLRELLELSPMGCSIATADGVSVFRNRRLAEMLGYTLEQLKTVNASDYWVYPEDRLRFVEQLKRDGRVLDFRSYCKRPDGSRFTALLNASMEDVFGGRHIVSWSYDITRLTEEAVGPAGVDAEPNQEASI
jgi:PAS domain S-box-containing protein